MDFRSLYHRLQGRKELCQIYANLTHTTPESCLEHHGEIVTGNFILPSRTRI